MNSANHTKRAHKEWIYKSLIFVATVALIVYFLPSDSKFNYHFDINKPWKYGQLIATFDFPVYKSEAVVKHEQDSILASFRPYYQRDRNVEKEAFAKIKENYEALNSLFPSPKYIVYIEDRLRKVYEIGIVSTEDLERLQKDSVASIRIVDNKQSIRQTTDNIFTVKKAYEYILFPDSPFQYKTGILPKFPLNEYLSPNLTFDEQHTAAAKKEILNNYSWVNGIVQTGQKIIDQGEIVNKYTYSVLESLFKESVKRSNSIGQKRLMLVGQVLFVSLLILGLMVYLELFRKDYYKHKGRRSLLLLFALVIFYCVITALHVFPYGYVIPYTMLPIIIRVFLDSRTAFMTHLVTILICSLCVSYPYEFIVLQLCAGLVSTFGLKELSQRSQLFSMSLFVALTYALVFFAFELIMENNLPQLVNIDTYVSFIINALLLLFVYPLLYILEKTFGFTSNVTLVELSNINNPLLRRMSEEAPGTFQHSMQVASLAAEAAIHIGAKNQLVRTGALYHDIGKMENPAFFTENQGKFNPHSTLGYEQSAQIVIRHVANGLRLAEKNNLPQVIKDFIRTHHGRGKTKYFYISWKNEHPNEEPKEEKFTYPGPNPFSKETAILMMADAVEAASRSLSEYTEETIGCLVEKIIDSQIEERFFKECPITFKEISTIKEVFKEKLKIIYHTRISYPELME
ncbi:Cyclic-di-AMP phosphodiesterase PgpH [termite gut metagenome]|uniref:Cyclic-di-AMP phosphodiesterase PgpH n=1 Tax=termite gut metagenome TaxID=433724 RepID=A0A5J4T000_9ZZZZ